MDVVYVTMSFSKLEIRGNRNAMRMFTMHRGTVWSKDGFHYNTAQEVGV